MASETVARYGFAGRRYVGKAAHHASQVGSHSWDNPKPVRQEGHQTGQVGQQVGVDRDGQFRATVRGWLDGPHDVGLGAAFLADEQGVALAGVPRLKPSDVGATVEVDQPVHVFLSVPRQRLVRFAKRVGVVEVARCADERPQFVG